MAIWILGACSEFIRVARLLRCPQQAPRALPSLSARPVDKSTGLRSDQTVKLISEWSKRLYPKPLRKVRVYDAENQVTLVLLTNQFDLPAIVIAELYRHRWKVELFFKWIKEQHLRLRSFYGRSPNAVRCQIWSAICAYLMVAIVKQRLNLQQTLNEILADHQRQYFPANLSGRAACASGFVGGNRISREICSEVLLAQ